MKGMFLVAAALLFSAAGCSTTSPSAPANAPTTQASAQTVNSTCVVHRGDKIDPKVTYLYQGQLIGFCCQDCVEEFKKDPDKYMKDHK